MIEDFAGGIGHSLSVLVTCTFHVKIRSLFQGLLFHETIECKWPEDTYFLLATRSHSRSLKKRLAAFRCMAVQNTSPRSDPGENHFDIYKGQTKRSSLSSESWRGLNLGLDCTLGDNAGSDR